MQTGFDAVDFTENADIRFIMIRGRFLAGPQFKLNLRLRNQHFESAECFASGFASFAQESRLERDCR